jgi:hypothetical protein
VFPTQHYRNSSPSSAASRSFQSIRHTGNARRLALYSTQSAEALSQPCTRLTRFILAIFISGLNNLTVPSSCLYAFIPSNLSLISLIPTQPQQNLQSKSVVENSTRWIQLQRSIYSPVSISRISLVIGRETRTRFDIGRTPT